MEKMNKNHIPIMIVLVFVCQFLYAGEVKYIYTPAGPEGIIIYDASDISQMKVVSTFNLGGYVKDLALGEKIIYAIADNVGVVCIDISNILKPRIVGKLKFADVLRKIEISADKAYIDYYDSILDKSGIAVIDIKDSKNMKFLYEIFEEDYVSSYDVNGNYIYLSDGREGIKVIEANEDTYKVVSRYKISSSKLLYKNNMLFAGEINSAIYIFDVTDPKKLYLRSKYSFPRDFSELAVDGDRLFVLCREQGVYMFKVNSESGVNYLTKLYSDDIKAFHISDNILLLLINSDSDREDGLVVLDISDIYSPSIIKQDFSFINGEAKDIAVYGKYAYIADYDKGIKIYDVSNVKKSKYVKTVEATGSLQALFLEGKRLYAMLNKSGISIYDLSDPLAPRKIGSISSPTVRNGLYVKMDMLFTAEGNIVKVYNVADPENIKQISNITDSSEVNDGQTIKNIKISDKYLILSGYRTNSSGIKAGFIKILDISAIEKPVFIKTFQDTGVGWVSPVSSPYFDRYYLYMGLTDIQGYEQAKTFTVFDIFDMRTMKIIGSADYEDNIGKKYTIGVQDLEIYNNYALLACGEDGIKIFNIRDPKKPFYVTSVKTGGFASSIFVKSNYAYVADGENGFFVLDIRNPNNPIISYDALWINMKKIKS